MNLKRISATTVAISMATLLIGAGGGWWFGRRTSDQEILGVALAHELELTGLCANALKLTSMQRTDKVTKLLGGRLDDALRAIHPYVDGGGGLHDFAVPNLRDSLRRAAD